jgi:hypothetical protein
MSPVVAESTPLSSFNKVLLPEPLAPQINVVRFSGISKIRISNDVLEGDFFQRK